MDKDALYELGQRIIDTALSAGADTADISLARAHAREVVVRNGEIENLETSDNSSASLRVIIDQQPAWISLTPRHDLDIHTAVERAISMAKVASKNPYVGLAEVTYSAGDNEPLIDTFDKSIPTNLDLQLRAQALEAAALDVKGISMTEGASASHSMTEHWLLTSAGFQGFTVHSFNSHGVSALAGHNDNRVIDNAASARTYTVDLESPATIGARAAERALNGLNAKKPVSGPVVAIFEPRVSSQLISNLLNAIKGANIARRSSFLIGRIDEIIASDRLSITDNPHMTRGLGSRLFDGEGATCRPIKLIDEGRLSTWLLNSESAKELGLRTTGHANRNAGIGTVVSNIDVQAGTENLADMISNIDHGVLVTQLLGHGLDILTGTFSLGACGRLIKKGKLSHAFNEATLAGNFTDMLPTFTPSIERENQGRFLMPYLRVENITMAGS